MGGAKSPQMHLMSDKVLLFGVWHMQWKQIVLPFSPNESL